MIDPFMAKSITDVVGKTNLENPSLNFKRISVSELGEKTFREVGEPNFSPLSRDIPTFKNIENDTTQEPFSKHNKEIEISNSEVEKAPQQAIVDDGCNQRNLQEVSDGFAKRLPRTEGVWEGEPGNSTWKPDPDATPTRDNPEKKPWGTILNENNIDGIDFTEGEPDFSEIANKTVEIDDYTDDRVENFTQADEKLAEKWTQEQKDGKNWSPDEIAQYRKDNRLTWHERSDMQTLDLVPRDVHGNISHSGGIAAIKDINNSNLGVA